MGFIYDIENPSNVPKIYIGKHWNFYDVIFYFFYVSFAFGMLQ